jgi:uncharacterized membrane protein YhfC
MIVAGSMAGIIVQFIISLFIPIGLVIYGRRKGWLSWKPLGVGILIFILFSQILEKLLHVAVIDPTGPSLKWTDNPFLFVVYATLAAGIFEEMGRYLGFRWLLKRHHDYQDGLSFGIGHGGIEAILIGGIGAVNAWILTNLIQSGAFEQVIAASLSADQAALLKQQVQQTTFAMYMLGGFERLFALSFHIAMSLLVLFGVRRRQFRYVIYAILLHALMDVAPALYQVKAVTNIWLVEGVAFIFAIIALIWTRRVKTQFVKEQG